MGMKEALIQQFTTCYDKNGWFVAIRNAIEGITAEQAAWKPEGADNSIWETLAHVCYYNYAYLQRFKGIEYEYDVADNDETLKGGSSEAEWNGVVGKFDSVMSEFRDLLEGADQTVFDQPVPSKPNVTWAELIADINAHNAYHGGQILIIRKLQGSWNPQKGVS